MGDDSSENRAKQSVEYVKAAKAAESDDTRKVFEIAFARAGLLKRFDEDQKRQTAEKCSSG